MCVGLESLVLAEAKMDPRVTSGRDSPYLIEDDADNKSFAVLPWDNFSNWIYCACIVTFDLELGQAMEVRN